MSRETFPEKEKTGNSSPVSLDFHFFPQNKSKFCELPFFSRPNDTGKGISEFPRFQKLFSPDQVPITIENRFKLVMAEVEFVEVFPFIAKNV